MLDRVKAGRATPKQAFDYYLGWLADPSITTHFQLIPDASVAYAKQWGMNDRDPGPPPRRAARPPAAARRVVVGGHSLGGSITTAYATWDFGGKAGREGPRRASSTSTAAARPRPVAPADAQASLQSLQAGSPWLVFGGIPAPYTGLFNSTGALGAILDPDSPSVGQGFPLLPANLKPPVPATNLGLYGYALDTETSPPGLVAAQAHLGHLAASRHAARLGPGGRDHADPALREDVRRLGPEGPRRHGLVPPAAADDRRRRGRRRQRQPRPAACSTSTPRTAATCRAG